RLARPDAVFPGVTPAARTRHDVIDAPFFGLEQRAGVLAAISIALANALGAKLRTLLRHTRKIREDDHRWHTDRPAHGLHSLVLLANRQLNPFIPRQGTNLVFALDFESGRDTSGHLAKGFGWRANVDRLPI